GAWISLRRASLLQRGRGEGRLATHARVAPPTSGACWERGRLAHRRRVVPICLLLDVRACLRRAYGSADFAPERRPNHGVHGFHGSEPDHISIRGVREIRGSKFGAKAALRTTRWLL